MNVPQLPKYDSFNVHFNNMYNTKYINLGGSMTRQ